MCELPLGASLQLPLKNGRDRWTKHNGNFGCHADQLARWNRSVHLMFSGVWHYTTREHDKEDRPCMNRSHGGRFFDSIGPETAEP